MIYCHKMPELCWADNSIITFFCSIPSHFSSQHLDPQERIRALILQNEEPHFLQAMILENCNKSINFALKWHNIGILWHLNWNGTVIYGGFSMFQWDIILRWHPRCLLGKRLELGPLDSDTPLQQQILLRYFTDKIIFLKEISITHIIHS